MCLFYNNETRKCICDCEDYINKYLNSDFDSVNEADFDHPCLLALCDTATEIEISDYRVNRNCADERPQY